MNTYEQAPKTKAAMTVVTIAAILGGVVLADQLKSHGGSAVTTGLGSAGAPSGTSASSGAAPTGTFKDGTYTATSTYDVPGGPESIQVTLTLKNNQVTSSSVQNSEANPTSADYEQSFAAEYQSAVVGKPLSGLQLDVVAGASATTAGFNDAVSQIAQQAKA